MCALLDCFSGSDNGEVSPSFPNVNNIKSEIIDDSDDRPFYCVYDAYVLGVSVGYVVEL